MQLARSGPCAASLSAPAANGRSLLLHWASSSRAATSTVLLTHDRLIIRHAIPTTNATTASSRRGVACQAAPLWRSVTCHAAPGITPTLLTGGGTTSTAPLDVGVPCQHHAAMASLVPVDQLLLLLAAAGFLVMLGALTGQTSLLEAVAHRAQALQPVNFFFLDPDRVMQSPPRPSVPPSAAEGGLTGTTHEQLESYVRLTAGSGNNPGVIAVRNRALATAASYSVAVAIKDSRARVRQMLEGLQRRDAADSTSLSTQQHAPGTSTAASALASAAQPSTSQPHHHTRSPQPSHTARQPLQTQTAGRQLSEAERQERRVAEAQAAQQERVMQELLSRELRRVEAAQGLVGPGGWAGLTGQQVDAVERQLLQAVAEQAALEQVEALLAVVAASQGDGAREGGGRPAHRQHHGNGNGDIRGGW